MLLRCVPEPKGQDESAEVYREGFFKEFQASQIAFPAPQFDYSAFIIDGPANPIGPSWAPLCRRIIRNLDAHIRRAPVLFPRVQRHKNISYETAKEYCTRYPERDYHWVTTCDLEVHYGKTGEMLNIGGCELRQAWKFNDLKPRFYYCQGGHDYFASRYLRDIAVMLMEVIPTTRRVQRINPELYLHQDFDTDYVTCWDFSSFTTNLSELKYFLYYIARGLESVGDSEVRLFDYHAGVVRRSISGLILEYNEEVNFQSPFSIHRIIDKFAFGGDDPYYNQQNSGMLGVAGNIGMSTACHGFHLARIQEHDNGVCVGDDAMSIDKREPQAQLIPEMSLLAPIEPSKFVIRTPDSFDRFRFLKRAWTRLKDSSFHRDWLFDLPIMAYIDRSTGHRTLPHTDNWYEYALKATATSIGQTLWRCHELGDDMSNDDFVLLRKFLEAAYHFLGIPRYGFLPGYTFHSDSRYRGAKFLFCCPPITFEYYDPRYMDWLEFMFDNYTLPVEVPVVGPRTSVSKPHLGEAVCAPSDLMMKAFEDMGYVKIEPLFVRVEFLSSDNRRVLRRMLKRIVTSDRPLCRITVIEDIPDVFDELFSSPSTDNWTRDLLNMI